MNRKLFFLLIGLFSTASAFSQESKVSVELNYPIPIGNNFIGSNYEGIIDIGIRYKFIRLNHFNIGTSINSGLLTYSLHNGIQEFNTKDYNIEPRFFIELDSESLKKLHPTLGLGYAFMVFKANGTNNQFEISNSNYSETLKGLNFNTSILYDISSKLFAQVQYDFIKITNNKSLNTKYNTTATFMKIGIGYKF